MSTLAVESCASESKSLLAENLNSRILNSRGGTGLLELTIVRIHYPHHLGYIDCSLCHVTGRSPLPGCCWTPQADTQFTAVLSTPKKARLPSLSPQTAEDGRWNDGGMATCGCLSTMRGSCKHLDLYSDDLHSIIE